jgi:hypothetical protein
MEFTTWNSAYMSRPSSQSDVAPEERDVTGQYMDQNYYAGVVKYYI